MRAQSSLPTHQPHGGVRPFHQKSTCLTQSTLRSYLLQTWSYNTPKLGPNETRVAHRTVEQVGVLATSQVSWWPNTSAVVRMWHIQDSQGQIMTSAFSQNCFNCFKLFVFARKRLNLSHRMYLLIGFGKSNPLQGRQLRIYY